MKTSDEKLNDVGYNKDITRMTIVHTAITNCLRVITNLRIELKYKENKTSGRLADFLFIKFIENSLEFIRDFICRKIFKVNGDEALKNVKEFLENNKKEWRKWDTKK